MERTPLSCGPWGARRKLPDVGSHAPPIQFLPKPRWLLERRPARRPLQQEGGGRLLQIDVLCGAGVLQVLLVVLQEGAAGGQGEGLPAMRAPRSRPCPPPAALPPHPRGAPLIPRPHSSALGPAEHTLGELCPSRPKNTPPAPSLQMCLPPTPDPRSPSLPPTLSSPPCLLPGPTSCPSSQP